ncbi:MAG: hypothetical protein K1X72_04555 [Pyrinomonadaceae bacterium]|nr:hypothetical protein [Pyrinomonadaceae bacterium]
MKSVKNYYNLFISSIISITILPMFILAQNAPSAQDKKVSADFEKQAKEYIKIREKAASSITKIPDKATAEQIEEHKLNLQKAVQTVRTNAKQGDIFTPEATEMFRRIIKFEFEPQERADLRKKILTAEVKTIPLKVNFPYPSEKEQLEMPPTLLLALPQLPKELWYRFVGSNFLLVDKENGLIIDFITNTLP